MFGIVYLHQALASAGMQSTSFLYIYFRRFVNQHKSGIRFMSVCNRRSPYKLPYLTDTTSKFNNFFVLSLWITLILQQLQEYNTS